MVLAQAWLMGDPEIFNRETDKVRQVTRQDIRTAASRYLGENKATVMYYSKKKKSA